jgi:hypothetical protein
MLKKKAEKYSSQDWDAMTIKAAESAQVRIKKFR